MMMMRGLGAAGLVLEHRVVGGCDAAVLRDGDFCRTAEGVRGADAGHLGGVGVVVGWDGERRQVGMGIMVVKGHAPGRRAKHVGRSGGAGGDRAGGGAFRWWHGG